MNRHYIWLHLRKCTRKSHAVSIEKKKPRVVYINWQNKYPVIFESYCNICNDITIQQTAICLFIYQQTLFPVLFTMFLVYYALKQKIK